MPRGLKEKSPDRAQIQPDPTTVRTEQKNSKHNNNKRKKLIKYTKTLIIALG